MSAGPVFYRSGDADSVSLAGTRVAVLGYGNLGSSVAHLLRRADVEVVIGNRDDSRSTLAKQHGFSVEPIASAAKRADLAYILLPDEVIPAVFETEIAPALRPGSAICFASGYCLAFSHLEVPADIDVLMLAPRMLGEELATVVDQGGSYVSYVSVEHDYTGKARDLLLGLAQSMGALRRGALELSATQEALLDLLVEQTVGPYLGSSIQMAFALGVEAGLPPEAMVLEMYGSGEMARVFQTFARQGFYRSVGGHGVVATYGGFLRTLELDNTTMRSHFRNVLEDIRSGGFAQKLAAEAAKGYPVLSAIDAITGSDDGITRAESNVKEALGSP